jgi:hypothetical protein
MAAWSGWLAGVGDALVDGGNPVGQTKTIGPDGAVSEGGGADPLNGYSLVNADSLDDALAIATKCPHLSAGGTVRVHETVQM